MSNVPWSDLGNGVFVIPASTELVLAKALSSFIQQHEGLEITHTIPFIGSLFNRVSTESVVLITRPKGSR